MTGKTQLRNFSNFRNKKKKKKWDGFSRVRLNEERAANAIIKMIKMARRLYFLFEIANSLNKVGGS